MKNKIVACLGWKYEPKWLIDELKENLSWVDDFAIVDCRDRDELWIHEGEYRQLQRKLAKEKGADWVLITSADERWEKNAGEIIRPLVDDNKNKVIYEMNLRELYTPTAFRWDGIWANKLRRRIYPLLSGQTMKYQSIQCSSVPQDPDYQVKYIDVNIYHLKMIEPQNRVLRARVFNVLDPTKEFQPIGYDYLADEHGILLKDIMEGREYYPKYKKYEFVVPSRYLALPNEQ